MDDKCCGNCLYFQPVNDLLGRCTGDILQTGCLHDRRDSADGCQTWHNRWPYKHLTMYKVIATSYRYDRKPFHVRVFCTDGHVYQDKPERLMQARCAGWEQHFHDYAENENEYTEETWTGRGLPVVTNDQHLIR